LRANVEEHSYRFNKNRRPNNRIRKPLTRKMNPLKHEIEEEEEEEEKKKKKKKKNTRN
jgi:hypothetical protein